jgi:hypothetical protein
MIGTAPVVASTTSPRYPPIAFQARSRRSGRQFVDVADEIEGGVVLDRPADQRRGLRHHRLAQAAAARAGG